MGSPGRGAAGWMPGSQAAALAGSSCSFHGGEGGFFHAPQAVPAAPQRAAAPGEAMFPAERKERQKQSDVEEREAEKTRRNGRARPNLAPPMGSVAAQRQVTISKLGPCSPGLVGGGKGRRSGREQRGCLPRQRRWLPPSPFSQDTCLGRSPSNTPLLGNLSVECSPQTLGCWERVGFSPRAREPEAKILIGGGGGCEGAGFRWGLGARECVGWGAVGRQRCRS